MFQVILFLIFGLHTADNLHPYHFSYAEIEYIAEKEKFEASLDFSTHDLEVVFDKNLVNSKNITIDLTNDEKSAILEEYINQHFFFVTKNQEYKSYFTIEGFESEVNGNLVLFLEAKAPKLMEDEIFFNFDLFTDQFSNQENKMTFIHHESKQTYNFNAITNGCWIQL